MWGSLNVVGEAMPEKKITMPEKTLNDKNWNEWSIRIIEELTTLTNRTEQLSSEIDDKYELLRGGIDDRLLHLSRKLDGINQLLTGNGTPERGLIIRVDRLEQNESRRTWMMRATLTACLAALAASITAILKHAL